MKYVLDASVAVAALRSTEPGHADALLRCLPLVTADREVLQRAPLAGANAVLP